METTANDVKNSASSAGQMASDKARQVGEKAKQVASNISDKVRLGETNAQEVYEMARERAEYAYDASADFVKRYPFATIAGAAAIGLVAGLMLRGSRD